MEVKGKGKWFMYPLKCRNWQLTTELLETNKVKSPVISEITRAYLFLCPTSASSERVISKSGMV